LTEVPLATLPGVRLEHCAALAERAKKSGGVPESMDYRLVFEILMGVILPARTSASSRGMCEQEFVGAFNDSFGSGSVGRQTITLAASVPRNAWQSAVSSVRPPRDRALAVPNQQPRRRAQTMNQLPAAGGTRPAIVATGSTRCGSPGPQCSIR
jgi:hypothetical protein